MKSPILKKPYMLHGPDVVCETIDGETIIINLKTGRYFSASGVTARLWAGIISGTDLETLLLHWVEMFDATYETISTSVVALVEQLLSENLIRAVENGEVAPAPIPFYASTDKVPFESIHLVAFDDMEALLQVDPIHDVDETGWPKSV